MDGGSTERAEHPLALDPVAGDERRRPVGGQAVPGGVMMRGERTWALAVRRADGTIDVDVHDNPGWAERYERIPLVRGVAALAESMSVGMNALRDASNKSMPAGRHLSRRGMAVTTAFAVPVAVLLFLVLPALAARPFATGHDFHLLDGLLRTVTLVGYVGLVGLIPDIRSVFQYHGAEHKAVAAYEAGAPLTPEGAAPFGTQHIRCGTNFLLTVVVVTGVVSAFFGRPGWAALLALRVVVVPLVVGLAYEWLRFAARHYRHPVVAALLVPGLALQRLTTREPSLPQLQVAMAALRALIPAEADAPDETGAHLAGIVAAR
jgi:uncharacterized protein YqhQ